MLLAFCLLYIIQSSYYVLGKREPLPRFLVEDGSKLPIFGSYSYDPVKEVFEPPPPENTTSSPGVINPDSTVHGDATDTQHEHDTSPSLLRIHKGPVTFKPTMWWLRPKASLKNLTTKTRTFK